MLTVLFAAVWLAAAPSNDTALAEARAHFTRGNEHYAAGRYEEAVREFSAGYDLVPRASFLLNLGQAQRKLDRPAKAKEAYLLYLRTTPESDRMRAQVLQILADIELELQSRPAEPAKTTVTEPVPQPAVPVAAPTPVTPVADNAPPRTIASPARLWGWTLGGVGVASAGAGLAFEWLAKRKSDQLTEAGRQGLPYDAAGEAEGRRHARTGLILLGAAGAALATGAVLLFTSSPSSGELALTPTPIAGGLGGVLQGSF